MVLLKELLHSVEGARWQRGPDPGLRVSGIVVDSRAVQPGSLFVAIRGTRLDGHDRIGDAVARGAAAVIAEREVEDPGVPVVRVPGSRRALAELAIAWHNNPAERLPVVGITGTLGKTSVLSMLEAILLEAGKRVGTIGSLGIRFSGKEEDTGHTVPGPLMVQRALADMANAGADLAAMEVTSHALVQERVHGLRFALGIFTNLVPLEHMEYHGSFEQYAAAKARFFDLLPAGAPLVFLGGDPVVRALVEARDLRGIGCGASDEAAVQVRRESLDAERMVLRVQTREPLPRVGGGVVPPASFPVRLRMLGRSNASNASVAIAGALCLGAPREAVQAALETMPSPPRRMQVLHHGRFTVIDDTVGHPDSITAVYEVAEALPHRRLHVVFVIRGQRGTEINRRDAGALAIWTERVPTATLIVSPSTDAADERNRVEPEERAAFTGGLHGAGTPFEERDLVEDAVTRVLDRAGEGDLVLLLGAQGMDVGAEIVARWLESNR